MEENEEKRGLYQKARDFMYGHVVDIGLGMLGIVTSVSAACIVSEHREYNKGVKNREIRQQEEHEKKMELYDKAKYSDNTNININV